MAKVSLHKKQLNAQVFDIAHDAARRGSNRVALRARASVLGQGRIDTHEMIRGFKTKDISKNLKRATFRVYNTAKHFPYQELGTPKGQEGWGRIYPKTAQALRFKPKGGSVFIFAKSVRGVRPGNFLKRAAKLTQLKDFSKYS